MCGIKKQTGNLSTLLRHLINKYKEDNKMSDYDIALEIGISQDTVRRFRMGDDVYPRTLEKIEKFFNRDNELSKEEIEIKRLKEENALLKEQLLKKSEQEQSFQSLLEEKEQLYTALRTTQNMYQSMAELCDTKDEALLDKQADIDELGEHCVEYAKIIHNYENVLKEIKKQCIAHQNAVMFANQVLIDNIIKNINEVLA